MKKIVFMMVAMLTFAINSQGQEIFKEVKHIQENAEALANDTTKNLESRKIACFKYDAIYYLIDKAAVEPTFTE